MKTKLTTILALSLFVSVMCQSQINELQNWININAQDRTPLENLEFSKNPITVDEARTVTNMLLQDMQSDIRNKHEAQWDNRAIRLDNYEMPFFYNIFGNMPSDGRSLFISLHGGGGTTAAANDQQYRNQQNLYNATMNNLEGVYLAPRATTNTWNLWHQNHIDDFLNIIIQMAVIKENVNPNKVYIMGYSAGGDGTYKLAPRMSDRWAAAAMMAGHPNDANPYSLRNTPFAIRMGDLDTAFNRNNVAKEWGVMLDNLEAKDPQGYKHDVEIYPDLPHWMELRDASALVWMKNFTRNPIPTKVAWRQDSRFHTSSYWLEVPADNIVYQGEVLAEYNKSLNEINIINNYSDVIKLNFNDEMLNLENPITIKYKDNTIHTGFFNRSILNIYNSLLKKGDANFAFSSSATVYNNETVEEKNIVLSTNNHIKAIEKTVDVFPNPAKDFAKVVLPQTAQNFNVSIFDLSGKLVLNSETKEINISKLPKSVYIVKVNYNGKIHTSKLIKI